MQRLLKMTATLLFILPSALATVETLSAAERKPNFVYVFTDDQRWDALGVVQREQGDKGRFATHWDHGFDLTNFCIGQINEPVAKTNHRFVDQLTRKDVEETGIASSGIVQIQKNIHAVLSNQVRDHSLCRHSFVPMRFG